MYNENADVLSALLDVGIDPNPRSEEGITALMLASFAGRSSAVIQELVRAGADANRKNDKEETAWGLIQNNRQLQDTVGCWELHDSRFR